MKTTIEVKGFEITISESGEGDILVAASKGGEVVEEFTLEGEESEDNEGSDDMDNDDMDNEGDDEMMPFGKEEEADFDDEDEEGEMDEEDTQSQVDEDEAHLESFSSFVKKRK